MDVKKWFMDERIIWFLRQADGLPSGIVPAASFGFSDASFYTWRAKFTSKALDQWVYSNRYRVTFFALAISRAISDTFFDYLLAH